ncbi:MAG TPA: c-type cytochrome [Acidimicrobiales bacterium]|nr:c-type cytochrome [Acidimicrobiales bacterium]
MTAAAALLTALTAQQRIGGLVVALVLAGLAAYAVSHLRRPLPGIPPGAEIELAPNRRPYFDDDTLEGPRLERAQWGALGCLMIVAIGLPLYWFNEPTRQKHAQFGFDKRAAERGFLLFQPADSTIPTHNVGHFGCAGCHGSVGQGGAAKFVITSTDPSRPPRTVSWKAPALNTVLLRYTPEAVTTIITYGRANTPMPAWGVAGGGPMGDQQIQDLVAYLKTIQLKPEEAKTQALQEGLEGSKLFDGYCSRCHTQGWSFAEPGVVGGGAYGPNLTGGTEARQFPDLTNQVDFITNGVAFGKPYGTRGIGITCIAVQNNPCTSPGGGMPFFGNMLSADQIKSIVAYERGL